MEVIFRSKEELYSNFSGFVCIDAKVYAERFMIQSMLTNLDDEIVSLILICNEKTIADRRIKMIEVSQQFVNGNRFDLNFGIDQFLLRVGLKVILVPWEVIKLN